jgi:hypothetical protein
MTIILQMPWCCNPNTGFAIKCELQGPMRLKVCLGVKHTLSQMGESARDEAQWLPNALALCELHLCKVANVQNLGLKRHTNTKLGSQNTIRKVLKCRWLKCPRIVHLDLICMSYDQKKGQKSNWEFDSQPQTLWK